MKNEQSKCIRKVEILVLFHEISCFVPTLSNSGVFSCGRDPLEGESVHHDACAGHLLEDQGNIGALLIQPTLSFPPLSYSWRAAASPSFSLPSLCAGSFLPLSPIPGQHNNTQGLDQSPKTAGSLIDAYQRIHCSWSVLSAPTIECAAVIASLLLCCAVLLARYCDCSIPHNLQMKPPGLDSPDRPSWHSIIYTSVMWFQIFHDDPWSKNTDERGKKCSTNTKQQKSVIVVSNCRYNFKVYFTYKLEAQCRKNVKCNGLLK